MINIKKLFKPEFYVSPIDRFMIEYDHKHPDLSKSQRKEVDKYKKIFAMRDNPEANQNPRETFWDKF